VVLLSVERDLCAPSRTAAAHAFEARDIIGTPTAVLALL
jgi:hypothetical protein